MNLDALPAFASDDIVHVVVECPRGSAIKWKYDSRLQVMSISRPLVLGTTYPCDWGFVPSTRAEDGDPIDALVIWDGTSFPGVVLPCRLIGVLQVEQNSTNFDPSKRSRNDRVLAIPAADRRCAMTDVDELPERVKDELAHFALAATALEGKNVRVLGWGTAAAALELVRRSQR